MKKICSKGFKVSSADQKALDNYLLETPKEWSEKALKGMINKATKIILRDWFETYKEKQTGDIEADYSIVIPAIVDMEEFNPYKIDTPKLPQVKRKEVANSEIWSGGFNVEDWEDKALKAYYSDPQEMLEYFMENKIYQRKKAFVKEYEKGFFDRKEAIPAHQDDFINLVCAKPGYKNRITREAEESLI